MKGTSKKKSTKKKTFKSGGKSAKRAALHAGNHQYNAWMKSHKLATQPPGFPQGTHLVKNPDCRCGGCLSE